MSLFTSIFGAKPTPPEHAVIVKLDGVSLSDDVYRNFDLSTLEDQLIEVIADKRLGEYDGNEIGETETILYMYGPDADRLFCGIEHILNAYPLCQGAEVTIRRGKPGATERKVTINKMG